jgi:hypothetical protein
MGKISKLTGAIAVVALAVVWIVGEFMLPERNPPGRNSGPILSAEGDSLLRRACFDCHSHETNWPRYTHWPVVSLLLAIDVGHGREELNFSDWDRLSPQDRKDKWKKSVEEIRDGEMPPAVYVWLHPEAKLGPADIQTLVAGAGATGGSAIADDDD